MGEDGNTPVFNFFLISFWLPFDLKYLKQSYSVKRAKTYVAFSAFFNRKPIF